MSLAITRWKCWSSLAAPWWGRASSWQVCGTCRVCTLAEIDRQGVILPAVGPQERLQAGDRLLFVGVIESVVDLQKMRGLTPATDQTFKPDAPRTQRCLIGSQLTRAERLFLAWFAPRGIVTASVASVFALRLGESSVVMVPATFLVIIVTVAVYAKEIARLTQ